MWAIDQRGALVNLDNAVWIGVVDGVVDGESGAESGAEVKDAALVAHMVDGTRVTLKTGGKSDLGRRLWEYTERLMLGVAYEPARLELEAQMRYED